jgi:Uma2 family endonuclease
MAQAVQKSGSATAQAFSAGSLTGVRTLVLDPETAGLGELMERRRRSGLDRLDEIWEGVYHMVPAPSHAHASIEAQLMRIIGPAADAAGFEPTGRCNIGEGEEDFRVPDCALHRPGASGVWHPTAAMAVEVVSPRDESFEKLPFYAARGVEEVLIVDPLRRSVSWLALQDGEYRPVQRSGLIELGPDELAERVRWPAAEPG